jgi:hypothetical protein
LLVRPERRWSSVKVIEALADVMLVKGVPEHIRSTTARSSWLATIFYSLKDHSRLCANFALVNLILPP